MVDCDHGSRIEPFGAVIGLHGKVRFLRTADWLEKFKGIVVIGLGGYVWLVEW